MATGTPRWAEGGVSRETAVVCFEVVGTSMVLDCVELADQQFPERVGRAKIQISLDGMA